MIDQLEEKCRALQSDNDKLVDDLAVAEGKLETSGKSYEETIETMNLERTTLIAALAKDHEAAILELEREHACKCEAMEVDMKVSE